MRDWEKLKDITPYLGVAKDYGRTKFYRRAVIVEVIDDGRERIGDGDSSKASSNNKKSAVLFLPGKWVCTCVWSSCPAACNGAYYSIHSTVQCSFKPSMRKTEGKLLSSIHASACGR